MIQHRRQICRGGRGTTVCVFFKWPTMIQHRRQIYRGGRGTTVCVFFKWPTMIQHRRQIYRGGRGTTVCVFFKWPSMIQHRRQICRGGRGTTVCVFFKWPTMIQHRRQIYRGGRGTEKGWTLYREVSLTTGDRQIDTCCFTPSQPRRVISGRIQMYSYHKYNSDSLVYTPSTVEDLKKFGENEVEWTWKTETT